MEIKKNNVKFSQVLNHEILITLYYTFNPMILHMLKCSEKTITKTKKLCNKNLSTAQLVFPEDKYRNIRISEIKEKNILENYVLFGR